ARLAMLRGRELATQMRVNQLVLRDMHDGVLVLDRDGRVVQHNLQAPLLLRADRLLGADIEALVPEFAERWRSWRSGAASAGSAAGLAARRRRLGPPLP